MFDKTEIVLTVIGVIVSTILFFRIKRSGYKQKENEISTDTLKAVKKGEEIEREIKDLHGSDLDERMRNSLRD